MFASDHRNVGQNQNIKKTNKALENLAEFQHWQTSLANQSCIHKVISS
jgi:hypothetical protein